MRSVVIAFLGLMLLAYACAAHAQSGFDAYLGRPVSELAMRIGPPTAASHRNGLTIFKWNRFGPTGQRIGASAVVEGLRLFTGRCVLVVASRPARSDPTEAPDDWIMEDWKFVGGGCV